ncbi:serine/threonine-protein kinase [Streptomyces sp. NPDC050560]|uniref:serine/threonine-protein kinase n=1 Tax=Streptomyces sp. NPDC050560 TaxID=3365630 RepID=UPI0037BDD6D4
MRAGDPPTVGAYELLGRLGTGGMGQVFLGRARDGRMVAVKVVREDLAVDAQFRQRFRAEVRAARRVGGVWTAPVLDCDTESAVPWVALTYVAGAPLQTVVDSLHGPLAERSVWALAHGLGQALTGIHGAGLIHRDLKPSNVMVSPEGPRVIDFGIARAVDASTRLTRTGTLLGTPGYMAPEQISGERLTGAVDVFALGAVLAYAATGLSPFSWDDAPLHTVLYRVMNHPPRLGPEEGALRGALRDLVVRCLAKEPEGRPELAEVLPLAQAGAGTDRWLPPKLTARLGRDVAALLRDEGRSRDRAAARRNQTTYVPPGAGPAEPAGALSPRDEPVLGAAAGPRDSSRAGAARAAWTVWSGRRRNRHLLGAVSAVLALAVGGWLVVRAGETGPPPEGRGGTAGSAGAPLGHAVPRAVRDAGGLTVHVADDKGALMYVEDGTPVGFEVDLMKEMGKRLGVPVRFTRELDDEDIAPAAVEKGRTVEAHLAVSDLADTPEHRKGWGVDMVDTVRSGFGLVGDTRHEFLSEVCGKAIVTYDDPELQNDIRDEARCRHPLHFLPADHREEMVDAIRRGEAEVAVLQYPLAALTTYESPEAELTASLVKDARGLRGIAVPGGQRELRDAVVAALKALMKDGTYQRLLNRWDLGDAAVGQVQVNGGH